MAIRDGGTDGNAVVQIYLTEVELTTLAYAMHAWDNLMRTAPRIEEQVSKSDALRQRRAAMRFNERVQSLAKGYGIEVK